MNASEILYFDSPGAKNTEPLLGMVAERLRNGEIRHLVVATSSGKTALEAASRLADTDVKIVAVTLHTGFSDEGVRRLSQDAEKELERASVRLVCATHVLSGLERSFSRKLGGGSRTEAVSEALRSLFGHGLKVCVEVAVMAADSGAIPCGNEEVIVIGGRSSGADTACVIRPGHANSFFDMEIREILAMPRLKRNDRD